ncbi:TPA: phage portal protein [Streptococcus pyogenes]|nr:phage portal protein [Streptococcus pyogenes]HEP1697523.1 phage portal protein [Streptococcus pyogenes]
MGIMQNFLNFFGGDQSISRDGSQRSIKAYLKEVGQIIQVKEYALQLCIDKISNALSLASFEIYNKGHPVIGSPMWWLFNMEPNQNQTQNQFMSDLITQMIKNSDGALVIMIDDQFVVAKNYEVIYRAFKPNIYKNVIVAGDYQLNKVFSENEVLHFVINDSKIKSYMDGLYDEYGKLIAGSIRNYNRGNALKIGLKIGSMFDQQFGKNVVETDDEGNSVTEADIILDEMYENRFKAVLSDKDSITPIEEGLEMAEIVKSSGNTKSGAVTTRDITDVVTDVIHFAGDAFSIPRGILQGDVADAEAIRENFVNFAVRPFADVIETEVNRKLYKRENYQLGNKFKIQTNTILVYSPENFAAAAEALERSGIYNPDELRMKLGEEPLNTDWSQAYYVTKNYARADSPEDSEMKGG